MGFQMQIQLFSLTFLLAKRSQRRRARRNGWFRRLEQLMSFSSVQASITVVPSLKVWIQRTESSRRTRDETRVGNPWLPPLLSLIGAQIPRAKNLNGTKFWSQKISLPIARTGTFLPYLRRFPFPSFFFFVRFFFSPSLHRLHPNNKLEVNKILIKDKIHIAGQNSIFDVLKWLKPAGNVILTWP